VIRGEGTRDPENSHRNVRSRINRGPSISGWLASSICRVVYAPKPNLMYDPYFVFFTRQRNKNTDHEPDPQNAYREHNQK
jgi:hypothetical protein